MLKTDRIVVYSVSYTWITQALTKTSIFDWHCNYRESTWNNLWQSQISQNTDNEKIEVVIEGIDNNINKTMICELYDANNDLYWQYKIVKVKKNKWLTKKVTNTHLIVTSTNGSES